MKNERNLKFATLLPVIFSGLFFAGCGAEGGASESGTTAEGKRIAARARLSPVSDSGVTGTVFFISEENGMRVTADISGLAPCEHGFHVHTKGDCSAPDASSAGTHFNPSNEPHAGRDALHRHVGDLGNIVAGADGHALIDFLDPGLSLTGANSIVGRAVIVHAGRDDLTTQPSGDSGPRVACGVIENEP